ncbi:unnamed protein product [Aureobasidium uvarum]|uniref:Clock-controlled protein 6 n=1 Tax=Aureobasidium uvarum TaxID=2773716 RepID=A0A9N8KEJ4_9PEZI|nr:unnamed protein product [Aureobasidium uvarum]
MKSFGVIALAASASAAYINGTAPANGTVYYTTEVVTAYSATTITVTNCPCTLTKPVASMATGGASNGTATATKPAIYTGAANNMVAAGYGFAALGAAVVLL